MMLYKPKKGHFFNVLYCLGQLLTFGIAGLKAAGSFLKMRAYLKILQLLPRVNLNEMPNLGTYRRFFNKFSKKHLVF